MMTDLLLRCCRNRGSASGKSFCDRCMFWSMSRRWREVDC